MFLNEYDEILELIQDEQLEALHFQVGWFDLIGVHTFGVAVWKFLDIVDFITHLSFLCICAGSGRDVLCMSRVCVLCCVCCVPLCAPSRVPCLCVASLGVVCACAVFMCCTLCVLVCLCVLCAVSMCCMLSVRVSSVVWSVLYGLLCASTVFVFVWCVLSIYAPCMCDLYVPCDVYVPFDCVWRYCVCDVSTTHSTRHAHTGHITHSTRLLRMRQANRWWLVDLIFIALKQFKLPAFRGHFTLMLVSTAHAVCTC